MYYQCIGKRICCDGIGKTFEISSRQVRFTTPHVFKPRQKIRLTVKWPVLLYDTCLLKLEVLGWIQESGPGAAAVKIERYEFRVGAFPVPARPLAEDSASDLPEADILVPWAAALK